MYITEHIREVLCIAHSILKIVPYLVVLKWTAWNCLLSRSPEMYCMEYEMHRVIYKMPTVICHTRLFRKARGKPQELCGRFQQDFTGSVDKDCNRKITTEISWK